LKNDCSIRPTDDLAVLIWLILVTFRVSRNS